MGGGGGPSRLSYEHMNKLTTLTSVTSYAQSYYNIIIVYGVATG